MALSDTQRRFLLFGTDEPVEPMRRLHAGELSAEFDRGNLRYIRWGGFEVLRGVAFVVRDTGWGTYTPVLVGVEVREEPGRFTVRHEANVGSADGSFRFAVEIAGSVDGTLTFHGKGESPDGFATNRTGFVVLHPLVGVVGQPLSVEHATGGVSGARFPDLIDPKQPVLDIRALRHEAAPGLSISVRMEGDTFEMEDHRNWTDASFKTYVRPLSWGFPYRIEPGTAFARRAHHQRFVATRPAYCRRHYHPDCRRGRNDARYRPLHPRCGNWKRSGRSANEPN